MDVVSLPFGKVLYETRQAISFTARCEQALALVRDIHQLHAGLVLPGFLSAVACCRIRSLTCSESAFMSIEMSTRLLSIC